MRTLFHFTLIVWLTAMAWAAGPRTEWLRSAGGPAYDEGLAACADSEGNLIVAGMIQGTATFGGTNLTSDQGGVLAKYSSAGNLLWARGLPSLPAAGGSWPRTLAADAQGNIHVAGEMQVVLAPTNGSTLNYIYRLFVSKYDPTGSLLWTVARTNGNFNTGAEGGGVWVYGSALDTAGNFYVAGDFSGSFFIGSTNLHDNGSGWTDFFFAKFSSTGNLLWVLDGGTNAFDSAHGIALGQNGRVLITGYSGGSCFVGPFSIPQTNFLAEVETNGTVGALQHLDYLSVGGLVGDGSGEFYAWGRKGNEGRAVLTKFSSISNVLWRTEISNTWAIPRQQSAALDRYGNIWAGVKALST